MVEMVLPIRSNGTVIGVFRIDSDKNWNTTFYDGWPERLLYLIQLEFVTEVAIDQPAVTEKDAKLFMITELSLGDVFFGNDVHPDSTPVGPFGSRAEAEEWVFEKMKGRRGMCSFTISPVIKPW